MAMHKIKFGIIGAGVISSHHGNALCNSNEAELVAVADYDREKLQSFAERFNVPLQFTDYQEMLKHEELDAVCVCVPSGLHKDVTIAAAEAGKHVLCEKPLEITREKMNAMVQACRAQGVKLGVVFQRRAFPAAIAARTAIREGKLGRLVLGEAHLKYHRSQAYYDSAGWRGTWAHDGGGALMNQSVHGIDLMQWMMGDVHSVYAYSQALVRDIEVEDTAVAVVKYQNGAFGTIAAATSAYPSQETRFELLGEYGTIIFGDKGIRQWHIGDSSQPAPELEPLVEISGSGHRISSPGHLVFIEDMAQAIREDREPMVNGEEARKAVDIILAIYESAREGKEVIVTQ